MLSSDQVMARLAAYLLQVHANERILSVRELAAMYRVSVGTVSNALTSIEETGAVRIDRRGHTGSFVASRSTGQLWYLAEREPMVIAFPLIAHPRLEGLATGLKRQLSDAGLDIYLIFIRGSRTRLKALRENKCHIAVMSGFSAERLVSPEEEIVMRFPPESFVARHEVFYRPQAPPAGQPLRVAIDRDSFDIEGLTELEFRDQPVEFIRMTFMQLPRLLRSGRLDAGIWSMDDMHAHVGEDILHRPLSDAVQAQVRESNTSAVLVSSVAHTGAKAVVNATLDMGALLEIQRKVMDGEMVPEY